MINKAVAAAHEAHHRELEMMTSIVAARALAAPGKPEDGAEAKRRLTKLVADADAAGFVGVVFEARLSLAEVEQISGNRAAALTQLDALDKDADAHGYHLIAQETATARMAHQEARAAKTD